MKRVREDTTPKIEEIAADIHAPKLAAKPEKQLPSRAGKKNLVVPIDPPLHKTLKQQALHLDLTLERYVTSALEELARKNAIK